MVFDIANHPGTSSVVRMRAVPELVFKLRQIRIDGALLKWLESYLSNRHMCVKIGISFSPRYSCPSEARQRGVLSPLLFVVYCANHPVILKLMRQ